MKKNLLCVAKKIKVWHSELLSSLLVIASFSSTVAQEVIPNQVFEQQGGAEIIIKDLSLVKTLTQHEGIYIDHGCTHHQAILYVTKEGYEYLLSEGVAYNYQKRAPAIIKMKTTSELPSYRGGECMPALDYYPSYDAYVQMMYDFQEEYPELCEIISIDTLSSGRELLVAHIGDNLTENEIDEPSFLYTSTMHGDETGGFPLMLNLIDHLLCSYDENSQVTELVDNVNIYINPLANPDGTYTNDNSSIVGATRRNGNFVDLNRNFPDPEDGENPDRRPQQEETAAFIAFAAKYQIDLSCNIHGGAEVVNYPWDTWNKVTADESWWIQSCQNYADTVQAYGPAGYMSDFNDGITNGFDWYEVNGGRQDLMNYFYRTREMTLEISNQKTVNSEDLPQLWEANRAALLNYMYEARYGLRGVITDCETGLPIEAEILIPGHDRDNSSIFSDAETGAYFRFLDDGTYDIEFIADGYETVSRTITIFDKTLHIEGIELCKTVSSITEEGEGQFSFIVNGNQLTIGGADNQTLNVELIGLNGQRLIEPQLYAGPVDIGQIHSGIYLVKLYKADQVFSSKVLIP